MGPQSDGLELAPVPSCAAAAPDLGVDGSTSRLVRDPVDSEGAAEMSFEIESREPLWTTVIRASP